MLCIKAGFESELRSPVEHGAGTLGAQELMTNSVACLVEQPRVVSQSPAIYIEDAAPAYMLLAEHLTSDAALRGQAFNFSNEIQVSVLELVDLILRKIKSSLRPEAHPRLVPRLPGCARRDDTCGQGITRT